jgi:hypothetical protein
MYNNILNGILHEHGLHDARSQHKFIESLRPIARELWESYQTQVVSTRYKNNNLQDCYLLRYFPFYAGLLSQELTRILPYLEDFSDDWCSASFFGCGPAPELVSLLNFLTNAGQDFPKMVQANLFDIADDDWEYARNISLNYVIPDIWDSDLLEVNSYTSDFTSKVFWKNSLTMQDTISNSNLVVFQKCLNEIQDSQYKQVIDNIQNIISGMVAGSIIIFIDQEKGKYGSSDHILNSISAMAEVSDAVIVIQEYGNHKFNGYGIRRSMPDLIKNTLLYSLPKQQWNAENHGLILRSTIPYSSLIIKRL